MSPRKGVPIIDVLPERYPFRDDGCDVSPSCLICPLPRCKYDDPVAYHRELKESRNQKVVQMKRAHETTTTAQLAQRFGVSPRTIDRILERTRGEL